MEEDDLDSWRSCNELTLIQAALLIANKNPSHMDSNGMTRDRNESPDGFDAAMATVSMGLRQGIIEGRLVQMQQFRLDDEVVFIKDSIDPKKSTIMVDSLKEYLKSRGRTTGFFFPETASANQLIAEPNYLDPHHPRYAPKLAAAVQAWIAVGESSENSPKTPKKLLEEWLLQHAQDLKLTDNRGIPNKLGIDEVAKVANWKPTGGAPKTPGKQG